MATKAYENAMALMGSQLNESERSAVEAAAVAVNEQNAEDRRKANIKKQTGIVSGTEVLQGMGLAGNTYEGYQSGAQERIVKTQEGVYDLTQGALDVAESSALVAYGQRLLQEKQKKQKKRYSAPVQKSIGKAGTTVGAKAPSTATSKYTAVNSVLKSNLGDLGAAGKFNAALQTPEQRAETQLEMKKAVLQTAGPAAVVRDFAPNLIVQQQEVQNAATMASIFEQMQARIQERSAPITPTDAQAKIDYIDEQLNKLYSERNKQGYALRYTGNSERYKGATEAVGQIERQIRNLKDERSNYRARMNTAIYLDRMKTKQNPDFVEKSKVNTESTDDFYRGINSLQSMAAKTGLNPAIQQAMNGNIINQDKTGHTGGMTAGEYMTPDEKSVYNYIYNNSGAKEARRYVDEISAIRNERYAADVQNLFESDAKKTPILASAASVLLSGTKAIGAVYSAAQWLSDGKIDVNSPYFFGSQVANGIRGAVTQQIADGVGRLDRYTPEQLKNMGYTEAEIVKAKNGELRAKGAQLAGNALGFAYQTGMSIADFLLYAQTGSTAALTIMGAGAGSDAVVDAKQRGATDGQALAVGALAGIAEVFFEKYSLDHYYKMASGTKTAALKNVLAQSGIEASEELFTEITNIFNDLAIMGNNSNTTLRINAYKAAGLSEEQAIKEAWIDNLSQVGLAALGGLISGGAIGTGAMVTRPNVVIAKNVVDGVIDITDEATVESLRNNERVTEQDTFDAAVADAAERTNAINLEQMHATADNPLNVTLIDVATVEMKENGATDEEIRTARDILGKMTTGQEVTPEERDNIIANESIRNTFDIQEETPRYRMNAEGIFQQEGNVEPDTASTNEDEQNIEQNQLAEDSNIMSKQEKDNIIELGRKLKRNVEFRSLKAWENGYYENGVLILNDNQATRKGESSLEAATKRVFTHELTHSIEGTSEYNELADFIIESYEKKGASEESIINGIITAYKTLSEGNVSLSAEDAKKELVAKFAEEYLLTDEKMITSLVRERTGIAGKILNWIQFQIAKIEAKTKPNANELIMILKAERLYIKAFAAAEIKTLEFEYAPENNNEITSSKIQEQTKNIEKGMELIRIAAQETQNERGKILNLIKGKDAESQRDLFEAIKKATSTQEFNDMQSSDTISEREKAHWVLKTLSKTTKGKKRLIIDDVFSQKEPTLINQEEGKNIESETEKKRPEELKIKRKESAANPDDFDNRIVLFDKSDAESKVQSASIRQKLVDALSTKWPGQENAEQKAIAELDYDGYLRYLNIPVSFLELESLARAYEEEVLKIPNGTADEAVLSEARRELREFSNVAIMAGMHWKSRQAGREYSQLEGVNIAKEIIDSDPSLSVDATAAEMKVSHEMHLWVVEQTKLDLQNQKKEIEKQREVIEKIKNDKNADPILLETERNKLDNMESNFERDVWFFTPRHSVSTKGMTLDELLKEYGAFDEKKQAKEAQKAKEPMDASRKTSTKASDFPRRPATDLADKMREVLGYQTEDEYKTARRAIEKATRQITSDSGLTKQKQDELFAEVMTNAKDDSDRARVRIAFDDAIFQTRLNLGLANRYEAAKHAREQRTAERAANAKEMDLVRKALEDRKPLKRQLETIKKENIFTESDNNDIEYMLNGGQIDLNGRTNAEAMRKRLEVEMKLRDAETLIGDYNKARKKYLFDQATRAIEGSYNWNDKKWGLGYSTETMERNIQDIVKNDAQAERIIETFFTPVHQNEAESTRFKEGMRRRIKSLNLTEDESKAVQLKGEGATLEQIEIKIGSNAMRNLNLDKIDRAVKEFRSIYDELLSKANDVLVQNGYSPIEYRKDYFPHFNDPEADTAMKKIAEVLGLGVVSEELPTDIAGLTAAFRPGKPFFGHMLERTGETTTIDAIRGFESYISGASDMIYHTEDIQRLRALESALRYEHSNEGIRKRMLKAMDSMQDPDETQAEYDAIFGEKQGHLGHLVQEIREYTNLLANKKSSHDRSAEADFGRKMYSTVNKLNSRVAANMIAGNVGVALTNFIPLTQAWATTRTDYLVVGMAKTLESVVKDDGFEHRSDFLTNRAGSTPLGQTPTEKVSNVLSIPFTAVDGFVAQSIVRAQFMQNVAKGMSPDEAMKAADRWAGSIMADRSKGALPTIFKRSNPLAKMTGMFQVEVNNQFRHLFKDIPRAMRDKGLAALAVALFKFCVGAWIYNEITEPLTGRRAAMDPVNIFKELATDIEAGDMTAALENLWKNIMDQTPFIGSLLGGEGGRVPISNALPDVWSISKNVIDAMSGDVDWKKAGEVAEKELAKPVWYLVPPIMGGQAKKIHDGIITVAQGGSYTLDKRGNEQLQFRTDKELKNYIQAAIFGKWALPEGQEYVKNGFKFMSAKETEGYRTAQKNGVGEQTYMQIRMRLNGIGPTTINGETVVSAKDKQRRELMNWPDLTPEQKTALDHYLIADDEEKTPDYSSEALLELDLISKDAHDVAVFVQKYGISPETYLKYAEFKQESDAIDAQNDVPDWAKKNGIVEILNGEVEGKEQIGPSVNDRIHTAIWNDFSITEKQRYIIEAAITGSGTYIKKAVELQNNGVPDTFTYRYMTEARDLRGDKAENEMDYSDNLTLKLSIASESKMTAEQKMKLTDTIVYKSTLYEDSLKAKKESGVSQEAYYAFYSQYWTLNAKDDNGKTVSGLKKKRAKELLDSLGISDEQQKYLLFDTGDYTKW